MAAQIARFTASGACFGAAARPKRRRAMFPEVIGPASGKGSADTGGTMKIKTAIPSRI